MKTLSIGDRGSIVELLQLGLNRAGFDSLVIDGIFGPATEGAVFEHQKYLGLSRTGIADSPTWDALNPFLTGFVKHKIVSGDTYNSLARKYSSTIAAIKTANPEQNPLNLLIGTIVTVPLNFNVVPTDISFSSYLMEYELSGLSARYPFIKSGVIGKSVMGKNIYSIDIGEGQNNVFYNASHHANEWITGTLLMKFLEDYAKSIVSGTQIGGLSASLIYSSSKITLVPLVNPDGVDLVTGALNRTSYYNYAQMLSQNYPGISFPSGWKANIAGVDLNLQYPAGWERAREIKFARGFKNPGPRDYVGNSPLSEPESQAVYNLTRARSFSLTISYHSQGQVIYWKYAGYNPTGSWKIAQEFSRLSGYLAEETPSDSGNAGYKDWFIKEYNKPGYTIEVGLGENPLPISQFDKIYRDNVRVLAIGAIITNHTNSN